MRVFHDPTASDRPSGFVAMLVVAAWLAAPGRGDESGGPAVDKPPSPQEIMSARGFIRYRGSWRTVQEIELIERAERVNVAHKEWVGRLERMRKRLDVPAQAEAAAATAFSSSPTMSPTSTILGRPARLAFVA